MGHVEHRKWSARVRPHTRRRAGGCRRCRHALHRGRRRRAVGSGPRGRSHEGHHQNGLVCERLARRLLRREGSRVLREGRARRRDPGGPGVGLHGAARRLGSRDVRLRGAGRDDPCRPAGRQRLDGRQHHPEEPAGILVQADSGITQPRDLEGKTCAISPFGFIHKLVPAFATKTGISENRLRQVSVAPDALVPGMAQKRFDAMCDMLFEDIYLRGLNVPTKVFGSATSGSTSSRTGSWSTGARCRPRRERRQELRRGVPEGVQLRLRQPEQGRRTDPAAGREPDGDASGERRDPQVGAHGVPHSQHQGQAPRVDVAEGLGADAEPDVPVPRSEPVERDGRRPVVHQPVRPRSSPDEGGEEEDVVVET